MATCPNCAVTVAFHGEDVTRCYNCNKRLLGIRSRDPDKNARLVVTTAELCKMVPRLFIQVTRDEHGAFEAGPPVPIGSQIVGRGMSALEAIGDYCLQRQLIVAQTIPFELVDTAWQINEKVNQSKLVLRGCDRRD